VTNAGLSSDPDADVRPLANTIVDEMVSVQSKEASPALKNVAVNVPHPTGEDDTPAPQGLR
jgi:hypothetical protein